MIRPIEIPQPGDRVGFVFGPGEFPADCAGVVLAHSAPDRWGSRFAVVHMDDGSTRYVHGTTTRGVGCYVLRRAKAAAG